MNTAADALVELLSTLARRQHEHRETTARRLETVAATGLLPADLHEMAIYYLAKAHRDLGRSTESRRGMQYVADSTSRLAPGARRGLAHLARLGGDFPTALDTARTLGWAGRHPRVEGDVWWPHGDMRRAATAYQAARDEAEHHGVAGERATSQAQRAFALAFTDPAIADDELDLADHLIDGLDLRATRLTTQIAALVRDAGTPGPTVDDRAELLRTETRSSGITAAQAALELALAFHHAIRGETGRITAAIARLQSISVASDGDYAYFVDIVHHMAGLPLPTTSTTRWIDGEEPVRAAWRALVQARQA